jgi:hypothetical protein
MQKIKDQEQVVRTNIAVRREALFQLDEVGSLIKWRTRLGVSRSHVSRSKLIEVAASLFYEVREGVNYEAISEVADLRRELVRALVERYGEAPAQPKLEEGNE